MFAFLFMAQPQGAGADPAGSMISTVVMFGGIILVFYFMMIRPQQKRAKEHRAMLEQIKRGDKVVTASGIKGTVYEVDEKTVTVTIASNVHVEFEKSAISGVEAK